MSYSKNKITTFLIFFLAFIIQMTLFDYIKIFNIKPNIIIILIVCYSLAKGSIRGGAIGLILGIVIDIMAGKIFGINTFVGFYTGLAAGLFHKRFFRESYIVIIAATFIFTFFYEFIFYFMKYFVWTESGFYFAIKTVIFPEALYNSVLVIPVRYFAFKIDKWLESDNESTRI